VQRGGRLRERRPKQEMARHPTHVKCSNRRVRKGGQDKIGRGRRPIAISPGGFRLVEDRRVFSFGRETGRRRWRRVDEKA
jgi:hypothetical protein